MTVPETARYREAGECDVCGHSVDGLIVVPWPGAPVRVKCEDCGRRDDASAGVYIKPRSQRRKRWQPGKGKVESMSP